MTIETNETGNRLLVAMNKWLIAHEDAQIEGKPNEITGKMWIT